MASASSSGPRTWDRPARSWEANPEDQLGWNDSDDEAPALPAEPSPEEALEALGDLLVGMFMQGDMSAKLVCCISYWAKHAGLGGLVLL